MLNRNIIEYTQHVASSCSERGDKDFPSSLLASALLATSAERSEKSSQEAVESDSSCDGLLARPQVEMGESGQLNMEAAMSLSSSLDMDLTLDELDLMFLSDMEMAADGRFDACSVLRGKPKAMVNRAERVMVTYRMMRGAVGGWRVAQKPA